MNKKGINSYLEKLESIDTDSKISSVIEDIVEENKMKLDNSIDNTNKNFFLLEDYGVELIQDNGKIFIGDKYDVELSKLVFDNKVAIKNCSCISCVRQVFSNSIVDGKILINGIRNFKDIILFLDKETGNIEEYNNAFYFSENDNLVLFLEKDYKTLVYGKNGNNHFECQGKIYKIMKDYLITKNKDGSFNFYFFKYLDNFNGRFLYEKIKKFKDLNDSFYLFDGEKHFILNKENQKTLELKDKEIEFFNSGEYHYSFEDFKNKRNKKIFNFLQLEKVVFEKIRKVGDLIKLK